MNEEYKNFGFEYIYDDGDGIARWVFELPAKSWDDARKRLKAISDTGMVYGEDVETLTSDDF